MALQGHSLFTFQDIETGFVFQATLRIRRPNGRALPPKDIQAEASTVIQANQNFPPQIIDWTFVDVPNRRVDYQTRRANFVPMWGHGPYGPYGNGPPYQGQYHQGYNRYPYAPIADRYGYLVPYGGPLRRGW